MTSHQPRVVVVGAGILGVAMARELALRGARVTLLDREQPGSGATGVAFAWLTNQTHFRNAHGLPDADARHYFGLHRLALGAWRRLQRASADDLGVRWHGTVQLTSADGPDRDLLERDLRRRLAWGSPSHRIDADTAARLLPEAVIPPDTIGFHTADEGSVDPNAALAALMRAVERLGVEFRSHTEVLAVDGTTVVTAPGSIDAEHVVITSGADSPALLAPLGITAPLTESSGSIVHLAPMHRILDPVLLSFDVHAIQRPDGRLVIARHYSGSTVGDPDGLDSTQLLAEAAALLPALRDAEIEKTTTGRRIVPGDGLPIIGHSPVSPGVHSITTNAGITLAPILAQLMTTEILDGATVDLLTPYRDTRFAR
ncbi:MAG: FAD-dependent oxidoreductase [Pseudonocardiaceae bacterium]|nr:FAD-dependent oxidoreductase [Pseudonocardiaceae bacterium]